MCTGNSVIVSQNFPLIITNIHHISTMFNIYCIRLHQHKT